MVNVKQISILLDNLDNHPGRLMNIVSVLTENDINIKAITLAEANNYTTVRIIVDNLLRTASILKRAGLASSFTDVMAMEVPNVPGGLINILKVMNVAGINVEYMYAVQSCKNSDKVCMIFKLNDNETAAYILQAAGIKILSQSELAEL